MPTSECQARFANAAWTDQRDQSGGEDLLLHLAEFTFSSDQTSQGMRQTGLACAGTDWVVRA